MTRLDTMGFEQLAALKEQLAKQAKQAKEAKAATKAKAPRARPAASTAPAKSVDPVVHAIARLQKRFPQAFPKNPDPKVPLKIGIFEDLLPHATELGLTESGLRDAVRTWCRGTRYWTSMVEGVMRVNLAGQGDGQVSQADARRAQHLRASRGARAKPQAADAPNSKP